MPSFSCPLPVQCGGGRLSASSAPAPQDFSTSEAFSPRTVLTENICRCVQHIRQHFPTTMPFLTTPTITRSCFASAAHQADSWWLGHVEPDDVVIADIGGQALDIFLHGPESAHKIGILKTFTHIHSLIHSHSVVHTPKKKKKKRGGGGGEWWKAHLNSPNMMPSFNCPLPVQCGGGRLSVSLAPAPQDFSTSKAFSPCPRTVLTENICRCVQHIRVSLTHPMQALLFCGEFLLHIPCWLLFLIWGVSLTHPMQALLFCGEFLLHTPCWLYFFCGEFLLHIPCCLHFYLGSFS